MYDIKRLEAGQQQQQHQPQQLQQQLQQQQQQHYQQQPQPIGNSLKDRLSGAAEQPHPQLTCSVITPTHLSSSSISGLQTARNSPIEATHMTLLSLRRRRAFQRRACLLSILAAFVFGMALGVIVPMLGLPDYFARGSDESSLRVDNADTLSSSSPVEPPQPPALPYSGVAFIRDELYLKQEKSALDALLVNQLDTNADGSSKGYQDQRRLSKGRFRKLPERRLSSKKPLKQPQLQPRVDDQLERAGILQSGIYWGEQVERALPQGFAAEDQHSWERYVAGEGQVLRLEPGCGRMQNRMVVFADGSRACARYRQNTDQIQGEIFSYYLGQLLNISNLAPSAATVIDTTTPSWSAALGDITQAQWKEHRPVVLTRWLSDLEPAGIPKPFQPLERHLNKHDVWNLTQQLQQQQQQRETTRGVLRQQRLDHQSRMLEESSAAVESDSSPNSSWGTSTSSSSPLLQRLIELAQWSDLIVFDYLIANLDRVVNNLYNFQWNADIMAAPAHNLARQRETQLLVFLDNESGLLHGYRLLKKYEAYHSLLLDNLCIFRRPTIQALQRLAGGGGGGGAAAGRQLREIFERTTSPGVRDVLPLLPDKSIKILAERIDRVLAQVQKCSDSNSNSSSNKGSS